MKAYVIVPIRWEYNDDRFYIEDAEYGFSSPENVFKTLEEAKEYVRKKNIQEFRISFKVYTTNISGKPYNYQTSLDEYVLSDDIDYDSLQKVFDELRIDCDAQDLYGKWYIPDEITDDQILRVMDATNISFYEIVEVDIGG